MVNQFQEEFGRQAAAMAAARAFNEEHMLQRIVAALELTVGDRVLEVACGPGIVAQAIAPFATELVCVDATAQMTAHARERLAKSGHANVSVLEAFAEALPFDAAQFDVIVTRLSLHHFADVQAVLAECKRVLRPKGRLVVVDILSSADPEKSRLHNALERLRDPSHVHMFSQSELLSELGSGGFEPLFLETWEQQRAFTEWAKIVSVPGRTEPLLEVMRSLCRAELEAGIRLREANEEVLFTHTWLLVAAVSGAEAGA